MMASLEDFGRTVDREMARLREFFHREVKPGTMRGAVEALRATASRLNELADDIEKRGQQAERTAAGQS
jgi:hypothetical protein